MAKYMLLNANCHKSLRLLYSFLGQLGSWTMDRSSVRSLALAKILPRVPNEYIY